MDLDLPGKLRNTHLPKTRPLLPLFDAIVNALHAIEERNERGDRRPGRVTVAIQRDDAPALLEGAHLLSAPTSFEISDNGVGFDERNFQAFNTSDTTNKLERGAHGIGRFLWLKAFRRVEVSSVFGGDGSGPHRSRRFGFSLGDGVSGGEATPPVDGPAGTTVRLVGFLEEYQDACPKRAEVIAEQVVEHCVAFFLKRGCPFVSIQDGDVTIDLNELCREGGYVDLTPQTLEIKGERFTVHHVRSRAAGAKSRIHFLANEREVSGKPLHLVDGRRLRDEKGSFVVSSYLQGQFLDSRVNQERTGFHIEEQVDDSQVGLAPECTMADIRASVTANAEEVFAAELAPLREENLQSVRDFVANVAPQYRPVVQLRPDLASQIPAGLPPEKLDLELHKIRARVEVETKEEIAALLRDVPPDGYEERFRRTFAAVNDLGKSALAEHVVQRRAVLDLLEHISSLDKSTNTP